MKNIGILAGDGRFPFLVAAEIKKAGDRVVAVALKDEAEQGFENVCDVCTRLPMGKSQKIIDFFKANNVDTAVMVGRVRHAKIYSLLSLDLRAIKMMAGLTDKKTDTILSAITNEFAKDSIKLLPTHAYLTNLLAPKGLISGKKLNSAENADVDFGFKIAKSIAGLDIGQTVVVKDKSVAAVESIEGTDECIKRAYALAGENTIVVKVSKPNQDFRFDVPVIGINTVDVLHQNKVRAMAIEAGTTLMLDKDEIIKKADAAGITLVGI